MSVWYQSKEFAHLPSSWRVGLATKGVRVLRKNNKYPLYDIARVNSVERLAVRSLSTLRGNHTELKVAVRRLQKDESKPRLLMKKKQELQTVQEQIKYWESVRGKVKSLTHCKK